VRLLAQETFASTGVVSVLSPVGHYERVGLSMEQRVRRVQPVIVRRMIEVGSLVWAVVALSIGLATFGSYNSDARLLVIAVSIVATGSAALASVSLAHRRDRIAGTLLIVSVVAPTSFAWVLNVPALLVGVVLLVAPSMLLGHPRGASV
jgi:hypothetical protein